MHILTGGAGFIGSAFLSRLNQEGETDVLVVDELGSDSKWQNLRGKKFTDYIHKDDFLDLVLDEQLPKGIKSIIHMGACSSTTETNADFMLENNYRYTRVLAEWAIKRKVRFIYASSAATYGDGSNGFSDEIDAVAKLRPLNVYGYSKQLFDEWAIQNKVTDRITALKFFNVFGPNEYHKGDMASVVYKAFHQIGQSGALQLFKSYRPDYKDGEQLRDFIYVKDCNDVLWWLLCHPEKTGIFNLGTGRARSWIDLARAVFQAMAKTPSVEFIEMPEHLRARYQYFTQADMSKLRAAGYTKEFLSLEDSVADYVQNYLAVGERHL